MKQHLKRPAYGWVRGERFPARVAPRQGKQALLHPPIYHLVLRARGQTVLDLGPVPAWIVKERP